MMDVIHSLRSRTGMNGAQNLFCLHRMLRFSAQHYSSSKHLWQSNSRITA